MKATILAAIAGSTLVAAAPSHISPRASKVKYAGVNIAGFDFGCSIDGTCSLTGTNKPFNVAQVGNGIGQMNHFVKDDSLNTFRLPVGWQFLLNNQLGGKLDANNFAQYDSLVKGCLSSGASLCILDIHNYARWNGQIVGQGGPADAQLADVWKQLAQKYGKESKIAFGVMNEPHVSYVLSLNNPPTDTVPRTFQTSADGLRLSRVSSQPSAEPVRPRTSSSCLVRALRAQKRSYHPARQQLWRRSRILTVPPTTSSWTYTSTWTATTQGPIPSA